MSEWKLSVPTRFDFSDAQCRAIRAALGHRGGRATRKEARAWVEKLVADGVSRLPDAPARRQKLDPETSPLRVPAKNSLTPLDYLPYSLIPYDRVCVRCGDEKSRHSEDGYCQNAPRGRSGSILVTPGEPPARFTLDDQRVSFIRRPPKVVDPG